MTRHEDRQLVLLAGIPATGKTFFGQWLAEHEGFLHVDIEAPGQMQHFGLAEVWHATFANEDVSRLVAALRALGPRVLLDWGFPPECLHLVEDLKERGVQLWWFNAQRGIAREEFIKRGTGHVADFDHQMDEIEMLREDIDEAFKPHVLTVLSADGRRMAPAEIWQQVSSHAA